MKMTICQGLLPVSFLPLWLSVRFHLCQSFDLQCNSVGCGNGPLSGLPTAKKHKRRRRLVPPVSCYLCISALCLCNFKLSCVLCLFSLLCLTYFCSWDFGFYLIPLCCVCLIITNCDWITTDYWITELVFWTLCLCLVSSSLCIWAPCSVLLTFLEVFFAFIFRPPFLLWGLIPQFPVLSFHS